MSKNSIRILSSSIPDKIGQEITVRGSVQARRDHGKLIFIDIRDRTGLLQVVFIPSSSPDAHKLAGELRPEDIIEIKGKVNKRPDRLVNPKIVSGTVELEALELKIISKSETLPFDLGTDDLNVELPTLLDHRALTLRHDKVKTIFKVQSALLDGFRKAAQELDCVEIVVPTIAASSTEGGAEVFTVDYYGHKAFLTQSPQLYKQIMVPVFERVFTIAHAYRAEPSVTTRHLAETTQMDCEIGFVNFEDLMDIYEHIAHAMVKHAETLCSEEFQKHNSEPVLLNKIPRLTLREAQEVIYSKFGRDVRGEKDLGPADEVDICKWAKTEHKSDFITITHFPTAKRAFYTMPDPENPEYSLSFDLLFRGVEILSGSQRINNYSQLVSAIKDRGMDPDDFKLYLQAFEYAVPPEGGFSFGLERLTMKMLGLENVRQASLFPRDMERVDERFSKKTESDEKKAQILQKKH